MIIHLLPLVRSSGRVGSIRWDLGGRGRLMFRPHRLSSSLILDRRRGIIRRSLVLGGVGITLFDGDPPSIHGDGYTTVPTQPSIFWL